MNKLSQTILPISLLLIIVLPAIRFFLQPNSYWNMHDDMQVIRQLSMEKCLLDGQIPCRWVPDAGYEYGYPLFNFYPPLPYIIGLFYRFLGLGLLYTVKLVAATQIILTALLMYMLCKSLVGRLGGLLGAVFYTYAPYHAVNIYVRGAMNEAWASTFFPAVLYFLKETINKPKKFNIIGLSISFALIILSHNPMALIFSPVCLLWAFYWLLRLKKINNFRTYLALSFSALLSFSTTAFFLLPVVFETKFVQVESMFSGYYSYFVHFATLSQIFISNYWGDGASVWGTDDHMSFSVGYLHWIVPLCLLIYYLYKCIKTKKINYFLPLFLIMIGFFYLFMTHERSTPVWKLLVPIQKIQFPWRFLNPATFMLSLSSIFLVKIIKNKLIIIFLVVLVVILNLNHFYPVTHGPITDQKKLSGKSWMYLTTSGIYDYLPKTGRIAPQSHPKPPIDQVEPADTKLIINSYIRGTNWFKTNITTQSDAKITLATLVFPVTNIYINGLKQNYSIESEIGRPVLNINSGNSDIYFEITNTPVRTFGNILSFISLLLIIFMILYDRLSHRYQRN